MIGNFLTVSGQRYLFRTDAGRRTDFSTDTDQVPPTRDRRKKTCAEIAFDRRQQSSVNLMTHQPSISSEICHHELAEMKFRLEQSSYAYCTTMTQLHVEQSSYAYYRDHDDPVTRRTIQLRLFQVS